MVNPFMFPISNTEGINITTSGNGSKKYKRQVTVIFRTGTFAEYVEFSI